METIDSRVLKVLKLCPDTRFNDMLLTLEYYNRYSLEPFPTGKKSFENVIFNYKKYGLPCFESIRRARQRVQSLFPELSRNLQEPNKIVVNIYL